MLWESDDARLAKHIHSGRLPSHATPIHAKTPGALVAIANRSGDVMWLFRLAKLIKIEGARVSNGTYIAPAYELVAGGKIRRPRGKDPRKVKVNFNAPGAFKYFDNSTGQSFRVTRDVTKVTASLRAGSAAEYPDELDEKQTYHDGAKRRVLVNAYERDPRARAECIAHHGARCSVCYFDFEASYGRIGQGFIHVHHLNPLSIGGKAQQVDPKRHLVPVCPNCHAMLHRGGRLRSINALRRILGKTG